ncbi:MAG: signal peptidase II [Acidimicrobiales bacterium]|nr:signal peptidase II [Acidimicrobiales bacterium]
MALVAGVAIAVVIVDQLTKWWALTALDDRIVSVAWTLRLNLAFNKGSAFGLGPGLAPFIAVAALAIVVILLRSGRHRQSLPGAVAVGLVLGGAIGNLLDRAFRSGDGFLQGGVVDFIDFQWWPIFNVADTAIVIGGILLVLGGLREPAPPPSPG